MQNQTEIPDKWPDKWLEILTCTLLDCYICDKKNKEKQRKASKKRSWKASSVNILVNDIEIFLKRTKRKRENMVANIVTISLKMKNKGKLSAGKTIQKCGQIRTDWCFLAIQDFF